jgi:hypothetical protein
VEPVAFPTPSFWQCSSLDDLAKQQAVCTARPMDELLGGWPADEVDDDSEVGWEGR